MSSFGVIPCRGKIKCVTQVIAQFLSSSACAGDRGHVSGTTRENAHRRQRDFERCVVVVCYHPNGAGVATTGTPPYRKNTICGCYHIAHLAPLSSLLFALATIILGEFR